MDTWAHRFLVNFAMIVGFNPPNNRRDIDHVEKRIVIALALFVFGFASVLRSNAGTEIVEPYSAPAPTYNYTPPPPVYYTPPMVGVVVAPTYGYYGPRFGYYRAHPFYGRDVY